MEETGKWAAEPMRKSEQWLSSRVEQGVFNERVYRLGCMDYPIYRQRKGIPNRAQEISRNRWTSCPKSSRSQNLGRLIKGSGGWCLGEITASTEWTGIFTKDLTLWKFRFAHTRNVKITISDTIPQKNDKPESDFRKKIEKPNWRKSILWAHF